MDPDESKPFTSLYQKIEIEMSMKLIYQTEDVFRYYLQQDSHSKALQNSFRDGDLISPRP